MEKPEARVERGPVAQNEPYAIGMAKLLEREGRTLAAAELRRLHSENASLTAALASSCDEQRHQLWESGGIAGCERARVAERQRDALLEALKMLTSYTEACEGLLNAAPAGQVLKARAAIAAAEGEKK